MTSIADAERNVIRAAREWFFHSGEGRDGELLDALEDAVNELERVEDADAAGVA